MDPILPVTEPPRNGEHLRNAVKTGQNGTFTPLPPKGPQLSFAERKSQMPHRPPSAPSSGNIVEGDRTMRDIDRPPPGDVHGKARRSQSRPDLTKQRSKYFEEAFSVKEVNPAKARVRSEAIVMADVKTNVIINDEFTFITELSYHLSTRYQRPISSILVTLQHGACMLFGGTFDPAYVMRVFALPTQLQPTTNKRNAALIQKHMEEAIGVPPSRGFLRFIPTLEEHTAWNGKTLAGEIDDLERNFGGFGGIEDSGSPQMPKRSKSRNRLSVRSFGTFRSSPAVIVPAPELTPPASAGDTGDGTFEPVRAQDTGRSTRQPTKRAKRSKSFVSILLGRANSNKAR